ncbi:MAG: Smr/MutS family protein [Desulfobacterales bacterium]|nr:Smr/MutS family protein [Desulfobacterales bacterium]
MKAVVLPIEDVLDLHTFLPDEVPDLINDYLLACRDEGIFSVRIIHGKGKGILKKRVRQLLAHSPLVRSYANAPPDAGGWGATLVGLYRPEGKSGQAGRQRT